jgi:hypothetical protein
MSCHRWLQFSFFERCQTGFGNRPTSVHVYIRRFTIDTVPTDPDEVEKWIYARYAEKDKLLQQFHDNGSHIVEVTAILFFFGSLEC